MPLTPEMRRDVDQIRNYLYGGGYPDPVSNVEQLSFLFFFYLVEGLDVENGARAKVLKQPYKSLFDGDWTLNNPLNATQQGDKTIAYENFRWSRWAKGLSGEPLVRFVRDGVFPFFAELAGDWPVNFMHGARLVIDEPTVLTQVVTLVDGLRLNRADADTKGDLFEHVLRQIRQADELGQFRTPRHIIRAIVEMIDPQAGETIYDPAVGTAGFLVVAYNHIRLANSSPEAIEQIEMDGKVRQRGLGDLLSASPQSALQSRTFYGNDVDRKMVHLATMNLALRGLSDVCILQRNVLTTTLDAESRGRLGLPEGGYQVVLANPPFSGRVDKDRIVDDVRIGTTTATELLFLRYMLDSLRPGGCCGVIVPEGVLFGSTGAHRELRRQLLENNQVEAVLSLLGGVFQPYSGVKTSVLLFRKGGHTESVLFLHADNDGYRMDANHDVAIDADDLPTLVHAYTRRASRLFTWNSRDLAAPWPEKWWFADAQTTRANNFNLSAGRYRPMSQEQVEHRDPRELLGGWLRLRLRLLRRLRRCVWRWVMRMSDFSRPLADVASIIRGVSFDKSEVNSFPKDGYLPILRAGNINGELCVDDDLVWVPGERVLPEQRLQRGDIAICMSSGSQSVVGKTAPLRRDWQGSIGAFCAVIRPRASDIVPEYLRFFLVSEQFRAWTRQSSGANIKNIRKSELEKFPIPLLPIDVQHRIVDLLSRAEGIGRLRREAQARAQAIIPALFVDMFGDPATNPKGWPVVTLDEVLRAADYGSSTKASNTGAGLPLIRMGNVGYDGALDLTDLKYVELGPEDSERFRLKKMISFLIARIARNWLVKQGFGTPTLMLSWHPISSACA